LISQSKEDAMHGRMAADARNTIWITYYKWEKMNNISRDKEVYVRRYANGIVSGEIHVSPEDVPTYEDHTDPAIAIFNKQPAVVWSWDFHKPKGYTLDAASPTIFARLVDTDAAAQKAFPVSAKSIDSTPVLGVCGGSMWCAWDSLGRSKKSLCVREITTSSTSGMTAAIAENCVNVCSPCFASYKNTKSVLTWSQTKNGKDWSLWKTDYDGSQKKWGVPSLIVSEGNPRFASCAYDPQGRLWLAYSAQTENGMQVIVKPDDEHGNNTDH
jgi:hypothetical protein